MNFYWHVPFNPLKTSPRVVLGLGSMGNACHSKIKSSSMGKWAIPVKKATSLSQCYFDITLMSNSQLFAAVELDLIRHF